MTLAYDRATSRSCRRISLDSLSFRHLFMTLPNLDPVRRAWCYAPALLGQFLHEDRPFMAQLKNDLGPRAFRGAARLLQVVVRPLTRPFDVFERSPGATSRLTGATSSRGLTARLAGRHGKSTRIDEAGVFERPEGRVTVDDGRVVRPTKDEKDESDEKGKKPYETLVLFGNTGEWAHGAGALVFDDGTTSTGICPPQRSGCATASDTSRRSPGPPSTRSAATPGIEPSERLEGSEVRKRRGQKFVAPWRSHISAGSRTLRSSGARSRGLWHEERRRRLPGAFARETRAPTHGRDRARRDQRRGLGPAL
jgi:hypothetical protein